MLGGKDPNVDIKERIHMTASKFKDEISIENRIKEAERIRNKYPDRIPIICEKAPRSRIDDIDKTKYLVPSDLTVGQFAFVIRKRLRLKPETAIFILVNNTFPSTSTTISALYDAHKDEDGFLYLMYSGENTFGSAA